MDQNDNKSLGYKLGQVLGCVITVCITAVIVGLTAKILFLMFR